jgi:thiol-disulfide isomerase/thioredoxin
MFKTSFKLILWTFTLLVLLGTTYTVYDKVKDIYKKESFLNNPSGIIYLFHAHWCGHCVEFRKSNIFNLVSDRMKSVAPSVAMIEIDVDKNKDMVKQYGVTSFPTILGVIPTTQKTYEFEGDRYDKKQLEDFVKKIQKLSV